MHIKRKQHILPESYLKHWVDAASAIANRTPMVWVFTKDAKRRQPKPPASGHFWRDYFYDLISTADERQQKLENILGRIEGCMAQIISQRIVRNQSLYQEESEELDLFVACMFMRTEQMRDRVVSGVSAMSRIEKEHAQAYGKTIPDTSTMEHNAHAHAVYDGVLFISKELGKMSHNVFVAPAGKAYLTSDTPCVWQAPLGFVGLANPTIEITLPLTPHHLLHISKTIPTSGYLEAPEFLVDQKNWETIRDCRNYFVGNSSVLDASWLESPTYWGMRLLQEAAKID